MPLVSDRCAPQAFEAGASAGGRCEPGAAEMHWQCRPLQAAQSSDHIYCCCCLLWLCLNV